VLSTHRRHEGVAVGKEGHGKNYATHGQQMKVMMNGVNVTDISQNLTAKEWDKLKLVAIWYFNYSDYKPGS
jgi:hypothetical protein